MKTKRYKATKKIKLFGVKTLFQVQVIGLPKGNVGKPDKDYDLFEERIVLIKAQDFNVAIKIAEEEAHNYEDEIVNPFGQKVKIVYLRCLDAFEMFTDIEKVTEVYSNTFLVKKEIKKKFVLDIHFGPSLSLKKESKIRSKFLNAEFTSVNYKD